MNLILAKLIHKIGPRGKGLRRIHTGLSFSSLLKVDTSIPPFFVPLKLKIDFERPVESILVLLSTHCTPSLSPPGLAFVFWGFISPL